MTLNEKFLAAVAKHIPTVDIAALRVRLAPIDIDARYIAACMGYEDARDYGSRAEAAKAKRLLSEVSAERTAILNNRK